ncbi:MAG: hypothetical protein ACRCX4_10670 [Bacteroidales bacterium]
MKAAQTTTFGVVEREGDHFPGVETIKLLRRIVSTSGYRQIILSG